MALVTIRILDGPEHGKAFQQIATPVSIGREDGNFIQLNDERVSRYHIKIHEDGGIVLLTDLQSTNGTKVNGEVVHTWRLKPGDLITVGRSVLLFGTAEEIADRLALIRDEDDVKKSVAMGDENGELRDLLRSQDGSSSKRLSTHQFIKEIYRGLSPEYLFSLQLLDLPAVPKDLPPQYTALFEEFLQYIHLRLRYLVSTVRSEPGKAEENDSVPHRITLSASQWQNVLDLHNRISELLNKLPEP